MKLTLEKTTQTATKPKGSRRDKMVAIALNTNGLSEYQKHLLLNFTYFMVGNSSIAPPAFTMLLRDFMALVPDQQKTRQLEYVVENKSRNLVPDWFREPSSGVTSTDNLGGRRKKSNKEDVDYSDGF